ncbi:fumarylacetoacetate hydrolase family protein [Ottowia sp.]|uniref:fumarylacetoacetate hydrolase family protein n=1 Tax=Ottowia sp. TaxID=1898956 RepID=UPI003A8C14C5
MKLATYSDGSRDGQLVVVSRDLSTAHYATGIAYRLQQALDDWNFMSPQLQDLYDALNHGKARHAFAFEPAQCLAPLPRAYQALSGAAYPSHVALLRAASGVEDAEGDASEPPLHQSASDFLLGACAPISALLPDGWGIDFEAQLAAITSDVPRAATPEQGLDAVRLLMLANGIRGRQRALDALSGATNARHKEPATAFSPVAVTPDELGNAWQEGRVHLALQTSCNGRKMGLGDAGADMRWGFGQLVAHAARTRRLGAGSIVLSGVVSHSGANKEGGGREWPKGQHCMVEKRAVEILTDGAAKTGYLQAGDAVRIDMKGSNGQSMFGAIEQLVDEVVSQ